MFTATKLKLIFPSSPKPISRARVKFIHHVSYVNYWATWEDVDACMYTYKPNMERLYQYYKRTKLVPYFNPLVVSFVRYIDAFIKSNNSSMFIACEELLKSWQ